MKVKSLSRVRLLATPWTAAYQAPLSWDFPGKNTGVGCHFLLQCMKVKSESEVAQSCPTLSNPMDCSLPGSSIMGFSRQGHWSGVSLPSEVTSSQNTLQPLRVQELHTWATSCGIPAHPTSMSLIMFLSLLKSLFGSLLIHHPISAQGPPRPRSLPRTNCPPCLFQAPLSSPHLAAKAVIRALHFHLSKNGATSS